MEFFNALVRRCSLSGAQRTNAIEKTWSVNLFDLLDSRRTADTMRVLQLHYKWFSFAHGDDAGGVNRDVPNIIEKDAALNISSESAETGREDVNQVKVSNRVITFNDHAVMYETNSRLGNLMKELMGLKDSKSVLAPGMEVDWS